MTRSGRVESRKAIFSKTRIYKSGGTLHELLFAN